MDTQMLKLLAGMPPEMLAAWEVKHPALWSVGHIARNYTRREVFFFVYVFVLGLLLYGATGTFLTMATTPPPVSIFLFLCSIFTFFATGIYLEDKLISHRTQQNAIIKSLEIAIKDSSIDLMFYLKNDYGSKRIQEAVHSLLVGAALSILTAEKRFNCMRKKEHASEMNVVMAGQDVLKSREQFNKMLFQAVQFGLSDGSSRKYFEEASRQLT